MAKPDSWLLPPGRAATRIPHEPSQLFRTCCCTTERHELKIVNRVRGLACAARRSALAALVCKKGLAPG
jgi:hypothetical protein